MPLDEKTKKVEKITTSFKKQKVPIAPNGENGKSLLLSDVKETKREVKKQDKSTISFNPRPETQLIEDDIENIGGIGAQDEQEEDLMAQTADAKVFASAQAYKNDRDQNSANAGKAKKVEGDNADQLEEILTLET